MARSILSIYFVRRTVALIALALIALPVASETPIRLRVGQVKTINPGPIERVAVGSAEMISTSLLKTGQLLIFGESAGVSSLRIWLVNGKELNYDVYIEGFEFQHERGIQSLETKQKEVSELLKSIPGLALERVGPSIVMTGQYDAEFARIVEQVKGQYPEILDLTLSTKYVEVSTILGDVDGLTIKLVGDNIVLSGEIDIEYEEILSTLQGSYPEILDLTRKETLVVRPKRMVLMSIQITEFSTNALESLGIDWGSPSGTGIFNGPGGAYAAEIGDQALSVLDNPATPSQFSNGPARAGSAFGYFGIATEITSRINLAVSSGNAVILASPRLVARSGGTAEFIAGGEIPIEIVTPTSAAVEFKEFGIILNIEPEVATDGKILARVETEISAVDNSVAVGDTPGFLTRRTSADVSMTAGETLVLSGLVSQEISEDISGLAGLSQIPVLGRLFRSEDFRDRKTELVIFLTPYVYDSSSKENIDMLTRRQELLDKFLEDVDRSSVEIID